MTAGVDFPYRKASRHTQQVKFGKPQKAKNENNVYNRCVTLINLSSSAPVWCIEQLEVEAVARCVLRCARKPALTRKSRALHTYGVIRNSLHIPPRHIQTLRGSEDMVSSSDASGIARVQCVAEGHLRKRCVCTLTL